MLPITWKPTYRKDTAQPAARAYMSSEGGLAIIRTLAMPSLRVECDGAFHELNPGIQYTVCVLHAAHSRLEGLVHGLGDNGIPRHINQTPLRQFPRLADAKAYGAVIARSKELGAWREQVIGITELSKVR